MFMLSLKIPFKRHFGLMKKLIHILKFSIQYLCMKSLILNLLQIIFFIFSFPLNEIE